MCGPTFASWSGRFDRRYVTLLLLCAVMIAYEVFAVFVKQFGAPSNAESSRRYVVGEIRGGAEVSQTLRLGAGGFNRVVLYPVPFADHVEGQVSFRLSEIVSRGVERPLYRFARPAADVVSGTRFEVAFPPIVESKGRTYRIAITMPGTRSGEGLGLVATRLDRYPDGVLFAEGREQWGDLIFETSATGSTTFAELERVLSDKPPIVRSRATLAFLFVLLNWALCTFVYQIVRAPGS